ncbi:ABC transporter ATP-binding protein [Cupriavidus necator]|uniref:ABC transporter ATP-binding protein n=1 Tax=Cupriavidus necator TaxID=106590 RepID=UPI0039C3E6E7
METGTTVLSAQKVSKNYKGFQALRNVDLDVRQGSIHGVIGPNGAGKTTLMNVLTCTVRPSQGRVCLDGKDVTGHPAAQVAELGLVRSFQICAVFPHLTVLQNVRLALQRVKGGSFAFWAHSKALRHLDERAMALLHDVGLDTFAKRPAAQLSYGRKRALEFATTLAADPRVLLLDEPMAGLGVEEIPRLAALIRRFADGRTVVLVEHHLPAIAELCDRVTVLNRGQVLITGTYNDVARHDEVRRAYLGRGTLVSGEATK